MGLQDDRDLPPVRDDASDDTETSSGGVNKKRQLNMYDLVSVNDTSDSHAFTRALSSVRWPAPPCFS